MKKNENFNANELMVDVVYYAFVEWLVRRRLYSAFRSNFLYFRRIKEDFRDTLLHHIRYFVCTDYAQVEILLFAAFPFISTPEGYDFWSKHSDDWRRFCDKFMKKL